MTFELTSPAFESGEYIPVKYTGDGENIHPPLQWGDPPAGTQSLALVMDDPDAPRGTWTHWLLYNLSPQIHALPEQAHLPSGCQEGLNSWEKSGYGGPYPPSGAHHYIFKLYALDTALKLPPQPHKAQLYRAMRGHVLAEVELMGMYSRQ